MIPFRYVEYYDVPRTITVRYRGILLLLQSALDEQLDDYPSAYSVFVVPELAEHSMEEGSWEFIESTPMACIGHVPIHSVEFDPSKRRALNPASLDGLVPLKGISFD